MFDLALHDVLPLIFFSYSSTRVAVDEDSLQTTWLQSPSGKASLLKQKLRMAALKANAMVAFSTTKMRYRVIG